MVVVFFQRVRILLLILLTFSMLGGLLGQEGYWQQEVDYRIEAELYSKIHQLHGEETLIYTNHSPDTLDRVYFHLYWNAFQPNSMMDVRSRNIADPDPRVGSRIHELSEGDQGRQDIQQFFHNGQELETVQEGTIMTVDLLDPIPPGQTDTFELEFVAQVPEQIRRSGKNNEEGIDYSMAQWYPKICAYDEDGWHPNPYIAREFYGTFGSFDVTLAADKKYTLGATGTLQNPESTLPHHGYKTQMDRSEGSVPSEEKIKWHFKAENVHDFVWAADPDYVHDIYNGESGVELHFFYQPDTAYEDQWKRLPRIMDRAMQIANERFGSYPYDSYAFIQGGDGGMEYPMATLITGNRSLGSLVGVSVHELMHSWYQGVVATDEGRYAWMDEGFTTYTSAVIMNELRKEEWVPGGVREDPVLPNMGGFLRLVESEIIEPMCTPADHFETNTAYSIISYSSGAVVLQQLGYILGEEVRDRGLLSYYEQWKFKHPKPRDFFRVMEKVSGIELDWYYQYMVHMTEKPVDYGVDTLVQNEKGTRIFLKKLGERPMPLDISIELEDGTEHLLHIPLRSMRAIKNLEAMEGYKSWMVRASWPWTHPTYDCVIPFELEEIIGLEVDPKFRSADINRDNNLWEPAP